MKRSDLEDTAMDDEALTRDMAFLAKEFAAVIERHFGVRLRHDRESVARLDRLFVESTLRTIAEDDFRNVSVQVAAYLGETVRALGGGRWKLDDKLGPCIVEAPGVAGMIRVLARAEKRIRSNEPDVLMQFLARACPYRN